MKQTQFYSVIYSDDDIVVFNKKSGLLVAADRYDKDAPRLDVFLILLQYEWAENFPNLQLLVHFCLTIIS